MNEVSVCVRSFVCMCACVHGFYVCVRLYMWVCYVGKSVFV